SASLRWLTVNFCGGRLARDAIGLAGRFLAFLADLILLGFFLLAFFLALAIASPSFERIGPR
ncbi:MAG: hypothetical protein ABI830_13685, partial [Pseudolabrys sp.]